LITEDSQAQALARRINAHIVIYGNVYVTGDRAEFTPRFYVSEQPDTRELTGQNELGLPIPFSVPELGANDPVNAEFKARTTILLNFTKALVYFSQRNSTLAENAIQETIKAANKTSQPFAGREVIYLLDSQVQLKQKKYELAEDALDQALSINARYARAFLARGNIFYIQALELDFDQSLLDKALAEYKQAFSLPDQPEGAYIPIKAHTAMGSIIVVKAQQTKNPALYLEAVGHFEYVISQYRQTKDPFLKSYASIAYFGLGAAYERQEKPKEAVDNYWNAYKLSDDKQFKERIKQQITAAQGR
jgi:tetratricopeptide (TPR) repeat protein